MLDIANILHFLPAAMCVSIGGFCLGACLFAKRRSTGAVPDTGLVVAGFILLLFGVLLFVSKFI
jgi:hypothetical protein